MRRICTLHWATYALIGVFGIFLAVFGYLLKKNSLAASGDPRFAESRRTRTIREEGEVTYGTRDSDEHLNAEPDLGPKGQMGPTFLCSSL